MVVNFGDIALSHQTVTRTLSLNNSGTANGAFSLEVSTLPSYLSVSKTEGVVEAKKDIDIEVGTMYYDLVDPFLHNYVHV